ncbi:MAG: cell division protein FtsQ/DivIB [Bdellovibrionales bacterium]|jgi:cell division protein FtsQ
MPRLVKKPLRGSVRQNTQSRRMVEEDSPRLGFGARLAIMVLIALAILSFASWSWHNRWPHRLLASFEATVLNATKSVGFAVSDVTVEGRHYTDRAALFAALGIAAGSPIFTFAPQEAHDKIMALPWTRSVSIIRSLPNKIIIRLTERQPIARWQHDEKTIVIDQDGQELSAAKPEEFTNLPLVVGNAAPEQTQALLTLLLDYPPVARSLKAAVRVGQRRWNFFLNPNILIRLPEINVDEALVKLTTLIQEQNVLNRAIASIDLRFPDRTVIESGAQPTTPQYRETSE